MRRPIDSYRVTGDTKEHAAYGVGPATDYAAPVGALPIGTPVRAPFPLASVTRYSTYEGGKSVKATSRDGRFEFHGQHLSEYVTNPGKTEGAVIAYSGNTGAITTGPHLHCYVIADGVRMSMEEAIRKYGLTGGAAGGSGKPLPLPTPDKEDEDMAIFTKPKDGATVYEIRNGRKRGVNAAEWAVTKAAYAAAGEKVPYAKDTLTKAQLNDIPNA